MGFFQCVRRTLKSMLGIRTNVQDEDVLEMNEGLGAVSGGVAVTVIVKAMSNQNPLKLLYCLEKLAFGMKQRW